MAKKIIIIDSSWQRSCLPMALSWDKNKNKELNKKYKNITRLWPDNQRLLLQMATTWDNRIKFLVRYMQELHFIFSKLYYLCYNHIYKFHFIYSKLKCFYHFSVSICVDCPRDYIFKIFYTFFTPSSNVDIILSILKKLFRLKEILQINQI